MTKKIKLTAIGEDLLHRPKLYAFLLGISKEARRRHGKVSYQMLHETFWSVLAKLNSNERQIIVGCFLSNMDEREIVSKNKKGKTTVYKIKRDALKKLEKAIFKRLPSEIFIEKMKKRK